jgi:hypothetical protein
VQKLADDHTDRFARVGLKINDKKTKGMVIDEAKPPTMMSRRHLTKKEAQVNAGRSHATMLSGM